MESARPSPIAAAGRIASKAAKKSCANATRSRNRAIMTIGII